MEIKNRLGLHLRAATVVAQTAGKFAAQITIGRGKNQANAKSVTALIMLGAGQGSKLKLRADGEDARAAIETIQSLFAQRFGEE